ncbi:MAG: hypothetical protein ACK55I_38550, partial [bacterium]
MAGVHSSSIADTGSSGANGSATRGSAVKRLKRRMDSYREMQGARLPQYEQTMNQVNTQQHSETIALRQKYLESKAKKPNKKSSSASSAVSSTAGNNSTEKQLQQQPKHDMNAVGLGGPPNNSPMNGMMQQQPYHGMGQQQQQ